MRGMRLRKGEKAVQGHIAIPGECEKSARHLENVSHLWDAVSKPISNPATFLEKEKVGGLVSSHRQVLSV